MLQIQVPLAPVSQQASRVRKNAVISAIQSESKKIPYFFLGDVRVEIEWYIHEQLRYESDSSADVDNIIKPILDALCGTEGVMFNDCQVQAVSCWWLDSYKKEEQILNIRIEPLFHDEIFTTRDIAFVKINNTLCFPVRKDMPDKLMKVIFTFVEGGLQLRDLAIRDGIEYYQAKYVQSCQRPFHISRVQGFEIFSLNTSEDEKKEIIQAIKDGKLSELLERDCP